MDVQDVPIYLGGTCYKIVLKIVSPYDLTNIFPITYYVYCDVRNVMRPFFSMSTQTMNEIFRAYLKRSCAELVEIEKLDDRLTTMDFKQGLYDDRAWKKNSDTIHERRSVQRRDDRDTPPYFLFKMTREDARISQLFPS
ncbi:unnamed protein product [Malus baccata var. baccata]